MSIVQITDYSSKNKNPYLIEIFRTANLTGWLESFDTQFNELEQVFFDLMLNMWIDTASGEQLDVLGVILDLSRQGRTDTEYVALLKAKVQLDISSGEPENLINAVKFLYDITDVQYIPDYPAKVIIYSATETLMLIITRDLVTSSGDGIITSSGDHIITKVEDTDTPKSLLSVVPAGVGLSLGFTWVDNNGDTITDDSGDDIIVTIGQIED